MSRRTPITLVSHTEFPEIRFARLQLQVVGLKRMALIFSSDGNKKQIRRVSGDAVCRGERDGRTGEGRGTPPEGEWYMPSLALCLQSAVSERRAVGVCAN